MNECCLPPNYWSSPFNKDVVTEPWWRICHPYNTGGTLVLQVKPKQSSPGGRRTSCNDKGRLLKNKGRFSTGVRKERESHRGNNPINSTDSGSELTPYTAILFFSYRPNGSTFLYHLHQLPPLFDYGLFVLLFPRLFVTRTVPGPRSLLEMNNLKMHLASWNL